MATVQRSIHFLKQNAVTQFAHGNKNIQAKGVAVCIVQPLWYKAWQITYTGLLVNSNIPCTSELPVSPGKRSNLLIAALTLSCRLS